MTTRWGTTLVLALAIGGASACSRSDSDKAANQVGRAAYKATHEAGKAARKAGREIKEAAKGVKDGWKEASREAKATRRK